MYIYIIMVIISLLFAYLAEKNKMKKIFNVYKILSIIPFVVVSAIRFDVGTDYMYRYAPDFEMIRLGGQVKNLEIGFKIIIHICIFIFNNYESLFAITTLITIPIIMNIIFKYSKKITLSIFLFFAGCYFFHSLNALRQYIAISIMLLAYKNILDNSYKKFIILFLLAFFIHYTSIVCIIAIFLRKKIITTPIVVAILVSIILVLANPLNELVDLLIANSYYSIYTDSIYNTSDLNNSALVLNIIVYILLYSGAKKQKIEEVNKMTFFINMQGMALIFVTMGAITSLFFRIAFYFSILQIISIPYVLYNTVTTKETKWKKIYLLIIILLFLANITYNNVINNVDGVLPYKTIFNKYN